MLLLYMMLNFTSVSSVNISSLTSRANRRPGIFSLDLGRHSTRASSLSRKLSNFSSIPTVHVGLCLSIDRSNCSQGISKESKGSQSETVRMGENSPKKPRVALAIWFHDEHTQPIAPGIIVKRSGRRWLVGPTSFFTE